MKKYELSIIKKRLQIYYKSKHDIQKNGGKLQILYASKSDYTIKFNSGSRSSGGSWKMKVFQDDRNQDTQNICHDIWVSVSQGNKECFVLYYYSYWSSCMFHNFLLDIMFVYL